MDRGKKQRMKNKLLLDETLAKALIQSTDNFFKKTLNMSVVIGDWLVLDTPLRGDYSGTVELFDTNDGDSNVAIMSISFMDAVIRFILKEVYGNSVNQKNDYTLMLLKDGIGEITNIVYSNVKTTLNAQGFKFKMSLPVIVEGKDHIIKKNVNQCLRIPCLVNDYEFYIDACISTTNKKIA
jgi:chemotaxis protein CheX